MAKRIAKLKVTTTRLQTVEIRAFRLLWRCPRCQREVEMLTSHQAAGVLEVDQQAFVRLARAGQIHTVRTVSGSLRVCKDSLVEVLVTVRNAADRNGISGAQVTLSGQAGVPSRVYRSTTDSSDQARITLKEYGRFNLEITQEYFEAHNSEVRIAYGETERDLPQYLLKEKLKKSEGSDLVSVKVLDGNKNNAPISGATVRVENTSSVTDAGGLATFSNVIGLEATAVAVTVTAPGHRRQTRIVPVRRGVQYTNASASATIVLEAGEDPAAKDTPILLVIEMLDGFSQQPLGNTDVQIRYKGKIVGQEFTNESGRAKFKLKDSPSASLADFRNGLKVDAYHDNYVHRESDITADLLMPSNTPRIITLHLERDWTALGKALDGLEGKVAAWDRDAREVSTKAGSVPALAEQIRLVDRRISALAAELNNFRTAVANFKGPGSQPRCTNAEQLKPNLEGYEAEARQKAQEVGKKLDAAAMAQRCAAPEDGAAIKRHHQDVIRLTAEIGRLDRQAAEDSRKLADLGKEVEALNQTHKEAEDLVRRLDVEVRAAEALAIQLQTAYDRGTTLSRDLGRRRDALVQETGDLKKIHGLDPRFIDRLPPDLMRRLESLAGLLASRNNDVFSGPNKETADTALLLLPEIRAAKRGAEKMLADFTSASCDINPLSDRVRAINQVLLEASADLGLAADLPGKADECARRGSCQQLLGDVRALLEEDNLELAESKINQARTRNCDVSHAAEELEYFRTVRRTANLLAESLENCPFQEALNLARRIPDSIQKRPLVAQAQQRIAQLRASARLAVQRTRQKASANSYIEEAEMAAEGFPCLMEAVERFREEFKGGDGIAKPQVEALPEDADEPVTQATNRPRRKPLPEAAAEPPAGKRKPQQRKPAVKAIADTGQADPRDRRPPVKTVPPTSPPAGSLPLANPWVKDAYFHDCCGGRTDFIYGLNTATRKGTYPPADGGDLAIEWNFDGVPQGEIRPGDEITITATGNFSASLPDRDLQPAAGAGVRIMGDVQMIEQKPAYVGRTVNEVGKYVFKVRPNAKSVVIELGADYGFSTFAIYRYGEKK